MVLTAFQDGTADLFRMTARVDLALSLLLLACASGLLAACWKTTTSSSSCRVGESATNAYGDKDRPCRGRETESARRDDDVDCYRRIDGATGRTLYLRNLSGIHFEMTAACSADAPEDEQLECKKEWSVVESSLRLAWFFRLYENASVGTASTGDARGHRRRRDDAGKYSFVVTAARLPSSARKRRSRAGEEDDGKKKEARRRERT